MSKGERRRIKVRVRTAIATQAELEGRYLGGRPPYGYVLTDAGPHPNPGKAATGQRLHTVAIDPVAAPVAQRIFTYRQALESGTNPTLVNTWINETLAKQHAARTELATIPTRPPTNRLSRDQINRDRTHRPGHPHR